jgi:hypothetical protein
MLASRTVASSKGRWKPLPPALAKMLVESR